MLYMHCQAAQAADNSTTYAALLVNLLVNMLKHMYLPAGLEKAFSFLLLNMHRLSNVLLELMMPDMP